VSYPPVVRNSLCDFRWCSLYGYISMSEHIIPEAEKAFARSLSISQAFLSPFHVNTFPVFGQSGNVINHCWKLLLGPEDCPEIVLLLRRLQTAEKSNWKRKKIFCWETPAT
jgi:hypothetical protein